MNAPSICRKGALALVLLCALPGAPAGAANETAAADTPRRLNLFRPATGEELSVVYRRGGEYELETLKQLDRFMRDSRTGDVGEIDRRIYDLLFDLTVISGHPDAVIEVLRAYETPQALDPLRRNTRVRKLDEHQRGRAVHVRLRGVELAALRDAALKLGRGGVGFYPDADYLHLDIGRAHSW